MRDLKGKVAIVTGAGRQGGIGAAVALRLAQDGVHVAIGDICVPPTDLPHTGSGEWEELAALAVKIKSVGVQSLPVRVDVTDAASIQAMIAQTREAFGRLDILVNNAGTAIGPAPVLHMAEEAWRRTLEINATGPFLCIKFALPLMIEGGQGGRIVNMASIAAEKPRPYVSAYAASKAAVVALTRSLAQEVAEFGITVNAVLPGDVDTAMKRWGLQPIRPWCGPGSHRILQNDSTEFRLEARTLPHRQQPARTPPAHAPAPLWARGPRCEPGRDGSPRPAGPTDISGIAGRRQNPSPQSRRKASQDKRCRQ